MINVDYFGRDETAGFNVLILRIAVVDISNQSGRLSLSQGQLISVADLPVYRVKLL